MSLLKLLDGKEVEIGAIDVASDEVETPEQVAAVIHAATNYVAKEKLVAGSNCGMAPMRWEIAFAKLGALAGGAQLARARLA
jgi:5-methyltetrahydropteroyltriglutamate--homocysteine methyltransferase